MSHKVRSRSAAATAGTRSAGKLYVVKATVPSKPSRAFVLRLKKLGADDRLIAAVEGRTRHAH